MIDYSIIKSNRKTISIQVKDNGEVVIRAPRHVTKNDIEKFIKQQHLWIEKKLQKAKQKNREFVKYNFSEKEVKQLKKKARLKIESRLKKLSESMHEDYKKFRLSGAKKRWGSCSSRKTISLNWRLIFVPEDVLDYIIIHELAHLKHMNHSKRFWSEVGSHCKEYKKHRKWLKENDYILRIDPKG